MTDYIDRQAAIWACRGYIYHDEDAIAVIDAVDCAKALENVPAADVVEVRRGYWVWVQYDANPEIGHFHCSLCYFMLAAFNLARKHLNYCPNCGARMEKGEEKEINDAVH